MSPTPLTYRPQTLRQAKRAHRKSGGAGRLSESEKAAIERRAVLQERLDRIKEKEARRKANIKKREEKAEREREARHRMGIATPPSKHGIHVGPSQLHLSGFLGAGVKRKREDSVIKEEKMTGIQRQEEEPVKQEQQKLPMEPSRSPQPLQTFSPNKRPKCIMPSPIISNKSSDVRDLALQDDRTRPNKTSQARIPLQAKPANSTIPQIPSFTTKDIDTLKGKSSCLQKSQSLSMNPPPPRPPVQKTDTRTIKFKDTPPIRFAPKPPKPEPLTDDLLDDFFVSNTQIQRELSPQGTSPANPIPQTLPRIRPLTPPPQPPIFRPPLITNEDTTTLLSLISTQDLDFSFELTQNAPAPALAALPKHEPKDSSFPSSFEEEEEEEEEDTFPDTELDSIVLEFSLSSPIKPSTSRSSCNSIQPPKDGNPPAPQSSNYGSSDDVSIPATPPVASKSHDQGKEEKHCSEAQGGFAAEWDAFELELSTQDLIELVS